MLGRLPVLFVAAALLLAGCGGGDDGEAPPPARADLDVASLAIDPDGGDVLLATAEDGLWRLAVGEEMRVARVGGEPIAFSGFDLAARGRLIASGRPGPGSDLPDPLGLVQSTDGGESWREVSLGGEAELVVLRGSGEVLYGVDREAGVLLASRDGGRSWRRRRAPEQLVDLRIDPRNDERLVAVGRDGMIESEDAGRTWEASSPGLFALLSWPIAPRLYAASAEGVVYRSPDFGTNWIEQGEPGGVPRAVASNDQRVVLALHDGRVRESLDTGITWRTLLAGAP